MSGSPPGDGVGYCSIRNQGSPSPLPHPLCIAPASSFIDVTHLNPIIHRFLGGKLRSALEILLAAKREAQRLLARSSWPMAGPALRESRAQLSCLFVPLTSQQELNEGLTDLQPPACSPAHSSDLSRAKRERRRQKIQTSHFF